MGARLNRKHLSLNTVAPEFQGTAKTVKISWDGGRGVFSLSFTSDLLCGTDLFSATEELLALLPGPGKVQNPGSCCLRPLPQAVEVCLRTGCYCLGNKSHGAARVCALP